MFCCSSLPLCMNCCKFCQVCLEVNDDSSTPLKIWSAPSRDVTILTSSSYLCTKSVEAWRMAVMKKKKEKYRRSRKTEKRTVSSSTLSSIRLVGWSFCKQLHAPHTPLSCKKRMNGIVLVTDWAECPRWGPFVCFSGNEEFLLGF